VLLNVHLVAHTHDDVGWLKTVDQYFLGANSSIQFAGVQYILDNIVQQLANDASKRFTFVEQAFFSRWFNRQPPARQALVRELVSQKRLVFANGGWCMHDEASSHYADAIDQTALGQEFIAANFGSEALPSVGWQIDPFGHSSLQASLLGPGVGFEAVFYGRADYADLQRRLTERQLEYRWQPGLCGAPNATRQFYGMLFGSGNYGPPEGFNFDNSGDDPIDDDPHSVGYNAPQFVEKFVSVVTAWARNFRGNDIMLLMGSDFQHQGAMAFTNIDILLRLLREDGRVNAFYSTPDTYLAAKQSSRWGGQQDELECVSDDLFPYGDGPHAYWTGYLSSRGALKRYIRDSSAALHVARQIAALRAMAALPNASHSGAEHVLGPLQEAMAVAQHHDAVAGTSQQHVACDYARRLASGRSLAAPGVTTEFSALLGTADGEECGLLNASICAATSDLAPGQSVLVSFWNPLGWPHLARVTLPVPPVQLVTVTVTDASGNTLPSQVNSASDATRALRAFYASDGAGDESLGLDGHSSMPTPDELSFVVALPPLGMASVVLSASRPLEQLQLTSLPNGAFTGASTTDDALPALSAGGLSVFVDEAGSVTRVVDEVNGAEVALSMSVIAYTEHDGSDVAGMEDSGQAGGAYIFRPVGAVKYPLVLTDAVHGPVMQEARFRAAPWAHFAVRLWHNTSQGGGPGDHRHVEIDYTVGPLPQTSNQSKSITLRLGSDIDSGAVWWTDAQGWTMQRRRRNTRGTWRWNATEPVAGNFMPSLSLLTLTSTSGKKPSLGVLPDRAMGVASLADGELELMIHRRLFHDDGRGVAEPLNETLCGCSPHPCIGMVLRGTLRLVVAPPGDDFAAAVQPLRAANERPPAVVFWPDAGVVVPPGPVSFLATQLPHSVHLVTLAPMHAPDELLLRLAHTDEDVGDQYPVSVDLDALFEKHDGGAVRVSRVRETLHNGVTPVAEQPDSVGTVVTLHPGQLRTFVVTI